MCRCRFWLWRRAAGAAVNVNIVLPRLDGVVPLVGGRLGLFDRAFVHLCPSGVLARNARDASDASDAVHTDHGFLCPAVRVVHGVHAARRARAGRIVRAAVRR